MYKKLCPKCHQPSFSSCESGKWICPICQNDLTFVFHQDAESSRTKSKPHLKLIINQFAQQNPKTIPLKQSTFNKLV